MIGDGCGDGLCGSAQCRGRTDRAVCDSIVLSRTTQAHTVTAETPQSARKAQIDAVLLKLPSVSAKRIGNMDAYVVGDRMFACISGKGVGLRLPVAVATELQFSRENVVPFQPGGMASTREWIQIDRADAADYEKDLELFQASIEFVKGGRGR